MYIQKFLLARLSTSDIFQQFKQILEENFDQNYLPDWLF